MNRHFKTASWDKGAKIATTFCFVLCVLLPWATFSPSIIKVICAGFFLIAYPSAPRGYTIMDDKITINRIIGNIAINRSEIKLIKVVEKFTDIALRLWASGGLFGYFGLFLLNN